MRGTFRDRAEAGRMLAKELLQYADQKDVLVLGLPRGGVPVAFEVAQALRAPLDVFVVRKLGVPDQPELAMGAIATGGVRVLNEDVVDALHIPEVVIDSVAQKELKELTRREHAYRGDRPAPRIKGRTVILVDDGIATGATIHAAIKGLRKLHPARLVVAVPTAALLSVRELQPLVDEVIALMKPVQFYAVGQWYDEFGQTSDAEVADLLERARRSASPAGEASA